MKLPALGLLLLVLQQARLPALTGRVVDEAGLLSEAEERELTRRLETLENETSVQIAIAIVPSIGDEPIEDYSFRLAEAWKVGQAGLDNGAVILVVRDEQRVRIEVGYGLEPVIPDGLAGRIIRERLAPALEEGDYYQGLLSAIEGLSLAARKEYPEAPPRIPTPAFDLGASLFAYFVVGVLGNALGILVAVVVGAFLFPLVGGSLAQALGLWSYAVGGFLGLAAVLFVRSSGRAGSWTSPGRYRGGSFSGGGFGGGGFRGGGGGFRGGGGRFGGGGASGRW